MAANYRAFRNRRSLLLLNLERQSRIEEPPWVRAVATQRGDGTAEAALLLRQLGELAVRGFPGTILPNPLVRELGVLARQSELGAPLVEELAADTFMDAFGPKFLVAARGPRSPTTRLGHGRPLAGDGPNRRRDKGELRSTHAGGR